MKIITINQLQKEMQSWSLSELPDGYAFVPEYVNTQLLRTYNGFVNLEIENNIVTSMTPNIADWNIWKSQQPNPNIIKSEIIRNTRNQLLDDCDWTQCLDAPITAATATAYREYRQALRDITAQETFPESVIYPTIPNIVNQTEIS